jgi:hypothetical protein
LSCGTWSLVMFLIFAEIVALLIFSQ